MENPAPTDPVSQKTILLVDDHILFREGMASIIRTTPDFTVVGGAGCVAEAIKCAAELLPDIILMDFSLPDGTGLDATRAILSNQPACQIVFLTIYEKNDNLFSAVRLGAKGFLSKNIPVNDLLASLRALNKGENAISRKMMNLIVNEFSHLDHLGGGDVETIKKLSPRELDILRALEKGETNRVIAEHFFLSENTVKHHVHSILEKLEAGNRSQAIDIARRSHF